MSIILSVKQGRRPGGLELNEPPPPIRNGGKVVVLHFFVGVAASPRLIHLKEKMSFFHSPDEKANPDFKCAAERTPAMRVSLLIPALGV